LSLPCCCRNRDTLLSSFPALAAEEENALSPSRRVRARARARAIVTLRHETIPRTKEGSGAPRGASNHGGIDGCRSASSGTRSPFGAPPRHLFRRPNATTQLQAALHSLVDRYLRPKNFAGPRALRPCGPCTRALHSSLGTLSTAKFSRTPGRPVVMPIGSMPEAARERVANPPAGTALAPHSGLPSGKRPFTERDN